MVTVICYGKEEKWESRKKAIAFYAEAMMCCEGSERDRYTNVYLDLMSGKEVCTDEEDYEFNMEDFLKLLEEV